MSIPINALRWSDLDPSRRPPFDPALARAAILDRITPLLPGRPLRDNAVYIAAAALSLDLLTILGPWSAGWTWARIDGGPLGTVAREALRLPPDAAVAHVLVVLGEWQQFLLDVAAVFADLDRRELPLADRLERAAARLLPLIIERTHAEDAWYGCFALAMRWYLEHIDHDDPHRSLMIDNLVSGYFASWVAPSPAIAADACIDLALTLADATPRSYDALAAWWELRDLSFRHPPARHKRLPVQHDGHRLYIDSRDRVRDPHRADRMLAALERCRRAARRGDSLTVDALVAWQALVLDIPTAALRTTDAFAKRGRERYPMVPDLHARLAAALAQSHSDESLGIRAARVYLDVCFLHPFADGNARAARLALDHVLTREALALHRAEPIFAVSRAADDGNGAWSLAHLVEHLVGTAN